MCQGVLPNGRIVRISETHFRHMFRKITASE